MRISHVFAACALGAVLACTLGVLAGSSGFGLATEDIFWRIRVPRVLAGFGAGAALAVSGALMQLLTRNALADPYVLGVAGGASVGTSATRFWPGVQAASISRGREPTPNASTCNAFVSPASSNGPTGLSSIAV